MAAAIAAKAAASTIDLWSMMLYLHEACREGRHVTQLLHNHLSLCGVRAYAAPLVGVARFADVRDTAHRFRSCRHATARPPRKRGRAVGEGERPRTLLVLVCGMLSSRRLQTF